LLIILLKNMCGHRNVDNETDFNFCRLQVRCLDLDLDK
jgi:hypothetical protein